MKITQNVYMLECSKRSRVFLVDADELILVDTGMPGLSKKIINEIRSLGFNPEKIRHILLTHHDIDHMGNAKKLKAVTGASLWCSQKDLPFLRGERNRPGVKFLVQTLIPHSNPSQVMTYSIGQKFSGIHVIPAPGHTPGHVIFQYKDVVFAGDLFKTVKDRFIYAAKIMNSNQSEYFSSLALLKTMDYEWVCPSHGLPFRKSSRWMRFLDQTL